MDDFSEDKLYRAAGSQNDSSQKGPVEIVSLMVINTWRERVRSTE